MELLVANNLDMHAYIDSFQSTPNVYMPGGGGIWSNE